MCSGGAVINEHVEAGCMAARILPCRACFPPPLGLHIQNHFLEKLLLLSLFKIVPSLTLITLGILSLVLYIVKAQRRPGFVSILTPVASSD